MTNQSLVPDIPGYRDVTLISSGSTSLVFRAVQSRLARTVAIKVLLVDGNASSHAQYQREVETTVLLSSQPHIVGIIDTGTTAAGNPYIVMEYCPGGSYGQILKQRSPLPVDEVVDVGMKIAEALQAAHDVGVLHRDVKPSNILRSAFGPALTDFGIARAPHQLSGTDSLDRLTPYHASPEAMRKDSQTAASDLYSLASALWHLLAGRPPFAEADAATGSRGFEGLMQRVCNEPPPRVPRADVPEWLQRELIRALAKDPLQRHPSAYTFAEILRYNAYRPPPQTAVPPPPAPVAPQVVAAPPVTGWPSAPTTAPREAFRWPQAAPTRREDSLPQPPAPALDSAAMQAAAASTVVWKDPSARPAVGPGADGEPGTGPDAPRPQRDEPPPDIPASRPATGETALTRPTEARPALARQVQPPVSAPPVSWYTPGPTSAPPAPVHPPGPGPHTPMSGPPMSGPPMSAPPMSGPPMSAPPMSGPPMSGPPMSGPPRSGPPMSAPPMPGPPMPAPAWDAGPSRSRRGWMVAALVAGCVLVLIVAIGVIGALRGGSRPTSPDADGSPVPSATRTLGVTKQGAPGNVKLTDDRTSVTVTWTDPSGGTVQFAVLGAPKGTQPQLLLVVDPGTTTYTESGVNAAVDYCYIVAAFYSASGTDVAASSPQVCTHRLG
jgi:hypothetical protein